MSRHRHEWKPLFARPTEQNDINTRLDWLLAGVSEKSAVICYSCGAVGMTSGGYRKGGGRNVVEIEEDRADYWKQRAEAWNRLVDGTLEESEERPSCRSLDWNC